MLRLNARQRAGLGETLRDVANLIFGGFVVGQVLTGQPLSRWLAAAGLIAWLVLVGCALFLTGAERW
jgi:hypothetical protein